ncbi:MAG TPA: efflux RND transporter permease subunit [Gemmataceae bacterium]|nr:efflux RND transporter permease subunit [Gemmataceae bacterium]
MLRKLIAWAVNNPLIVILMMLGLAGFGTYAFLNVNVEAYPDPAPAIVEVIAQYPGASAEEVERQVTIPLEVTLAGMPGLKYTRTKSLFGLSHLRNQFDYGIDYEKAKQEVINRLQFTEALPSGVVAKLSPQSPTGEILRYTLTGPKDDYGRNIYSLNDLKALQDWTLERVFKRIPRIIEVSSSGGTVKRYEVRPDPDRLRRYGITLAQLQNAVASANVNVGGEHISLGPNLLTVRGVGLIGGGQDPMQAREVLGNRNNPAAAVEYLRREDERRIQAVRQITILSINNHPIRVEDVVEGGPLKYAGDLGRQGVVVAHQTRQGRVMYSASRKNADGREVRDADGKVVWDYEPEKVQSVILLRKGEDSLPALHDVETKIKQLNESDGRMLPGVKIEPYYDRTDLIHVTTETVRENLVVGMVLVTVILFMFLNNVRSALIVAINIPLALLFAFSVLFLRGKSANLLSIGAVDFGIIVDSSVIMVENIYRHISAGEYPELPLKERISHASGEIQKALLFSTLIMVCAFLPLFTMRGPEGQIFGPMADTYAFALGGALLLALTVSPVLCLLFFKNLKPSRDNWLVRFLKNRYLKQLSVCLKYRWLTLAFMAGLIVLTGCLLPQLGREFMPELEEGNLWIRATYPMNINLDAVAEQTDRAQAIMRKYPEIQSIMAQIGRPDDGTDPTGFYNVEFFVPLKPQSDWPALKAQEGWMHSFRANRTRTKPELVREMRDELNLKIVGVDWNFSQNIRDNVMESLSGVKGDNSVKIIGPDLDELERLADRLQVILKDIRGVEDVGVFRVKGQPNLEFPIDRDKCQKYGVSDGDVEAVIKSAVGGQAFSTMIEGEKKFDITLRWPDRLRMSENAILKIPVDITNNQTSGVVSGVAPTRITGGSMGLSSTGTSMTMPGLHGSLWNGTLNYLAATPQRPLRDFITPLDEQGRPDPTGRYVRAGASTIYREQGERLIAVKFSVRNRDLASTVDEAQHKAEELFQAPYRAVWSGEFEEMQEAEGRLMYIIPLSLALILILLYMAFHSFLDAFVVLSNVIALSMGGIWALLLTNTHFSISAAVGFISLFGVAIMDGLLMISYFNQLRAQGLGLDEAIMQGAEKRVRPVMMTALTAILGLLPAAVSTRIGAQTQQPLAIVVVGGMITTLFLTRYLMPILYSLYGHREPPAGSDSMAH